MEIVLGRVENIVRKAAFSPFPTMFSRDYLLKVVKNRDCLVKS